MIINLGQRRYRRRIRHAFVDFFVGVSTIQPTWSSVHAWLVKNSRRTIEVSFPNIRNAGGGRSSPRSVGMSGVAQYG